MSTPNMEVLMTEDFYVIVDNEHSLWCNRIDGTITPKIDADIKSLHEPVCLGMVFGVLGKIQTHADLEKKLILIKQQGIVGRLPGNHETFKIQKIALLPLSQHELLDLELEQCSHHQNPRKQEKTTPSEGLQKTWNSIKTATSQVKPRKKDFAKDREKYDKRVSDELYKMFNDTDSFYYSLTGDLTNSLQRQHKQTPETKEKPLWARVDQRFFWNRHMLADLIDLNAPEADFWIVPMIQGYVQIERCWIDIVDDLDLTPLHDVNAGPIEVKQPPAIQQQGREYTMILISRRSRYRAGTRYKRRGVDESGKCANYVETEQIFDYPPHIVSFVQVRGSVPVFWSQPGYKYRPPPRLDKCEEETEAAFEKHFEEEESLYNSVVIINLVEQLGKEKVISDAYINHILSYDNPSITYVTFDFHEYCRGMKFENVSVLIESIKDLIRDIRYCWLDNEGLICDQQGTFRVNCIDCLDRTNIVQTALAKTVMDIQFVRLGLIPPEGMLPGGCRRVFQIMWANNGDIISRQYAGTVALKGDYTRTGERRLAGVMKDGYNSASRYYVNRFKDAYRQATIDMMLGNPITEDISAVSPEREEAENDLELSEMEHHERVKQLIEDCKKILIPESETVLGGWALIDADPVTGDPNQQDMDTILVLTKESYYVAEYDDETDRITRYQRVLLEDLERIELGPEPSIFKSKRHCLRLHYLANSLSGFFQMFRSTNTRFFNNMAVPIKNEEEAAESLKAICEAFKVALSVKSLNVPFFEGKLERRRSKLPLAQGSIHGNTGGYRANRSHLVSFHLDLPSLSSMPRNISEGQLTNLKNVGSRALGNMSSQIAKLNPIRGIRNLSKRGNNGMGSQGGMLAAVSETGLTSFQMDSSSDSEDDSLRKVKKHGLGVVVTGSGNFIHHISDRTLSSDYSECSDIDEHELAMISDSLENDEDSFEGSQDKLLESCGILATSPGLASLHGGSRDSLHQVVRAKSLEGTNRAHYHKHGHHRHVYHHRRYQNYPDVDDFVLDAMKKASLRQYRRRKASSISASTHSLTSSSRPQQLAPQIQISCENLSTTNPSSSNNRHLTVDDVVGRAGRKLSKSSEDLEVRSTVNLACSSNEVSHLLVHEEIPIDAAESLTAKMKTSHSESAIQDFSFPSLNLPNPLSSPIIMKKDLVLSPLSRIAKGVQNLGTHLRPNRHQQNMDPEEYEKMKERRKNCKSRIIDL